MKECTIYVALRGEGVDVWRPIRAEHVSGEAYRILAQPYDRRLEEWEFAPGDVVVCEEVLTSGGRILAARRRS